MAEILETAMIICFGVSWPVNLFKAVRSRTTKGSSLLFLCLIEAGYIVGIIGKFINADYMAQISSKWYVLFFYMLNAVMVAANLCVYFRNRRLDRENRADEVKNPAR